jgi:L-serine dehydratase
MKYIGALDLFTIGIGPSSSHTVGPMRAAADFAARVGDQRIDSIRTTLYGSLAATGAGHGTKDAVIAGFAGLTPEGCNPAEVRGLYDSALASGEIAFLFQTLAFSESDLELKARERLEQHSNGMSFAAYAAGELVLEQTYFSVGGGFIERLGEPASPEESVVPYPFANAVELLAIARSNKLTIAQLAYENEVAIHSKAVVDQRLMEIWQAMKNCIEAGLSTEGILPGYLKVPRRAKDMTAKLERMVIAGSAVGDLTAEWLQAFAIAVNEENAAGNRVVTAPTNGAAGIIPAVAYFANRYRQVSDEKIAFDYLLTAAAIGALYKRNASISGAEAGCQGEVGSACSMAAAGITAVMGGSLEQVENAAEIAMEHNLGLTCDPVGGFVQLPCIERNAIAAGTAVAAMRLALLGDGSHKISLDTVIETMRQTGVDMSFKYKETSTGGLAVNVVEC